MSETDPLEEVIFNAARQFGDTDKRGQYLDLACEGRPELRQRIERLLESSGEADAFFGRKAAFSAQVIAPVLAQVPTATLAATPLTEQPGIRIGRYKLLEQIGEGGFGVVFMADQEEPICRRVALKLIKLGMDTKQVLARFEAERQALALMDHPNIARVLDGGATETGRPFFVMELVQGVPITEFCDKNQLSVEQRLKLFIPVCQAIQSAHQKGIIHRDLKPTNILVTLNSDGSGFPKVIDFGVAKATDQKLTEKTLFTAHGIMIGTPAYMSPEQAEMSHLDVDTRADIYSLGALLYELLTSSPPFPEQRLRRAGYNEMQRIILEEQPERPSTRLSTLRGEQRSVVARNRGATELTLGKTFPGDLDWIVMKCLEKDRARRYETANGLARDLERHLINEPVVARPPSLTYRLKKSVRRNKLAVAAGACVVGVLVLGLCASTLEAIRARRAEREQTRLRHAAEAAQAKETAQRRRAEKGERRGERLLYAGKMNMIQAAWEQNRLASVRQLLNETADYPERGFEWYHWQRRTHLESKSLHGHLDEVHAAVFSPDGKWLVTGCMDATANVWDANSGNELLTLKGHLHSVNVIAVSHDGKRIATSSLDGTAKIWDAATGKQLLSLDGHEAPLESVDFSSDDQRVLTSSDDGTARVWDAATGKQLLSVSGLAGRLLYAAFSPDGRKLVTGGDDQTGRVWDAFTGEPLLVLKGHSDAVECVVYSPDGQRIVTGGDQRDPTARVWDAISGKPLLILAGHTGGLNEVRYSPDGQQILTASTDGTARLWEAVTGNELLTIRGHTGTVNDAAFSPDGRQIVTASDDHTVKIWQVSADREGITFTGHSNGIVSACISSDGRRVVAGGVDRIARVWDSGTGKVLLSLPAQTTWVTWVAISPDSRQLATAAGQSAKVWDAGNGAFLFALEGHTGGVSRLTFSPDSRSLAAGGVDKTARLWDTASGKLLHAFEGHTEGISGLAFSPDGRRLVTASGDATAKVWDLDSYKVLFTLRGHSAVIPSITYSPDGLRIATASGDQTAKIWDALTGDELFTLRGHNDELRSVGFSRDGQRLVTGSLDQTAKVWDSLTGVELLTLKDNQKIEAVAFSAVGQRILTGGGSGGGSTLKMWEGATAQQMAAWQADQENAEAQQAALTSQQTAADQQARSLTAQDPGAISQWLVLGPLPVEGFSGARTLGEQQIRDEALLRPADGEISQVAGKDWAWRAYSSDDYRLINRRVFRMFGPTLAYAVCYVQSDAVRNNLLMKVGSQGESKIYFNQKEIYRHDKPRKFVVDQDTITGVTLKKGTNVLVFKVASVDTVWRASLRFTDAAGQPVKGIRVTNTTP